MAGILTQLQEDNKQWHPVAFHSRKMILAERNYETHDQELLAIVTAFKHWRHYLEGSFHPVEVLTDHNNLKYFMRLAQLNGKQARWAMKLSMFDFFIMNRLGKINPTDAPSRRFDYRGENESLSQLLPILQHKLTIIGRLTSPILAAIQIAYGQGNRYPSEGYSSAIHSLGASEHQDAGGRKEADVRQTTLIGLMTAAWRETHLDAVHPSRTRDPQPLRAESNGETPTHRQCDVAEYQLNPIASTVGCKQLVPRLAAQVSAASKTTYDSSNMPIYELIKALQHENTLVRQHKSGESGSQKDAGAWTWDSQRLLKYNDKLYVPEEASVREELLRRHHDDPLARHFGVDKTSELMSRKYY